MAIDTLVRRKAPGFWGVAVGGGLYLPEAVTITATDEGDVAFDVTLEVELIDGRYQCARIACSQRTSGPPVTTNGLRGVPVGRLIQRAIARHVLHQVPKPDTADEWVITHAGLSDDETVKVAAIYRLAYACGLPPTTEVAKTLGVTQSVAGNRVMKARKAGLLDPTTRGKAKAGGGN